MAANRAFRDAFPLMEWVQCTTALANEVKNVCEENGFVLYGVVVVALYLFNITCLFAEHLCTQ